MNKATSWKDAAPPSLDDFAALADEAFKALPQPFKRLAGDVRMTVEDFATDEVLDGLGIQDAFELTGLYQGVNLADRSVLDPIPHLSQVFLYRRPILDEWAEQRGDVTPVRADHPRAGPARDRPPLRPVRRRYPRGGWTRALRPASILYAGERVSEDPMRVGVPREIKSGEYRVGLTPTAVREYVTRGHRVLVETGASWPGRRGYEDRAYVRAGAEVAPDAKAVFEGAELIVKVKEPQAAEWARLTERHILFTYLHLAPDPAQAEGLIALRLRGNRSTRPSPTARAACRCWRR